MRYGQQMTKAQYFFANKVWNNGGQLTQADISLGMARQLVMTGRGFRLVTSAKPGRAPHAWTVTG